ncbi:MAG: hypothetical protein AAGI03_03800 [Pseudomonadota bacterium]
MRRAVSILALFLLLAGSLAAEEAGLARVEGGTALITGEMLRPAPELGPGRARVPVHFPDHAPNLPVLGAAMSGPGVGLLRQLYAQGRAAGHWGDLYDNRDRDHSRLARGDFPQLTRVVYGLDLRARQVDYGAAGQLIFGAPVLGNSSTALTSGVLWRSQPRFLLTQGEGARTLYDGYVAGQIHVYPEHRDHDPDRGDLIPANTPYLLISQGSSGSDRPHLRALAMILAAFRPDTKARLIETGLLASTMQMVYRRARTPIRSRAGYLSGLAHPSVFGPDEINLDRMVALANAVAPDEIPPLVRLKMLDETLGREGVDFFGQGLSEQVFDTPSAIARIWRSRAGRREMLISADETRDPNGRELSFDWVLLRGDPDRVRIEPLDNGRRARITLDWQNPRPSPGAAEVLSPRIDIGVFAHNGAHDSAPGFISVLLPAHETRVYGSDGRVESIDYRVPEGGYADPLLFPRISWRDTYRYDADGALLGWGRDNGAGRFYATFDSHGQQAGALGPAAYRIATDAVGQPWVTETLN